MKDPGNQDLGFFVPQNDRKVWKPQKYITIFTYPSTLDRIDWDSFPSDIMVYVFGGKIPLAPFLKGEPKFSNRNYKNIICLDFLRIYEFYELLDTSEFVIIR